MTMPHLENCHHSESGWCLECVKAMYDEPELDGWRERAIAMQSALRSARKYAREDGITTRLFAQWCGISPTLLSEWTGDELPRTKPDFIERA